MYILWLILPLLVSACLALYLHACVCVCVYVGYNLELQAEVGVPTAGGESCPNLLTLSVAEEKHEHGIPALTTPERTRHFS